VGRVIAGKYKLESPIGSGATAAVFRARHLDLQRNVAVKILHGQKLGEMQFVKRFKGEALAASKLEHPNVARVIDFGQEPDGLLYLVMELLTGRSLEAILAASGRLPQRTAVTFAIQTCSALAFAHDVGIVHRDVKPENIMIVPYRDDDGNPCDLAKVCDFGLAKLRDLSGDGGGDGQGPHEDLTTAGMLCGSPAYMSPEQCRGEVLDGRSDIYSLGITLYESVTGLFPHEAKDLFELFTKKSLEPARKPSTLVPDIDPLLEDVLMRALATDPKKRHPDARVMREELKEVLASLEDEEDEPERTIVAD
jgi:serine/threonine-protein kinase